MDWPVTTAARLWRGGGSPARGPAWEALASAVHEAAELTLRAIRALPVQEREEAAQDAVLVVLGALRDDRVTHGKEDGFTSTVARRAGLDRLRRRRETGYETLPEPSEPPPRLAEVVSMLECLERASDEDRSLLTAMLVDGTTLEDLVAADVDPTLGGGAMVAAHRRSRNKIDKRWERAKDRLLACIEGES